MTSHSKPGAQQTVRPELEAAYISYSMAAGEVIYQLGRLAGLTETEAMGLVDNEQVITQISTDLLNLTNTAINRLTEMHGGK